MLEAQKEKGVRGGGRPPTVPPLLLLPACAALQVQRDSWRTMRAHDADAHLRKHSWRIMDFGVSNLSPNDSHKHMTFGLGAVAFECSNEDFLQTQTLQPSSDKENMIRPR